MRFTSAFCSRSSATLGYSQSWQLQLQGIGIEGQAFSTSAYTATYRLWLQLPSCVYERTTQPERSKAGCHLQISCSLDPHGPGMGPHDDVIMRDLNTHKAEYHFSRQTCSSAVARRCLLG